MVGGDGGWEGTKARGWEGVEHLLHIVRVGVSQVELGLAFHSQTSANGLSIPFGQPPDCGSYGIVDGNELERMANKR
jgi:hypothetical protein